MARIQDPVVAQSPQHLHELVREAMKTHGSNVDLNYIDVSGITSMKNLFAHTRFNGDISKWDVSSVRDMYAMFAWCECFNGDVSTWNVSNVIGMGHMFCGTPFNRDISKWDVAKVETFDSMFGHSHFAQDVSRWPVQENASMAGMFHHSDVLFAAQTELPDWLIRLHIYENHDFKDASWQAALEGYRTMQASLGLDDCHRVNMFWHCTRPCLRP